MKHLKHLKVKNTLPKVAVTALFVILSIVGIVVTSALTDIPNSRLDDATVERFVKSQPIGVAIEVPAPVEHIGKKLSLTAETVEPTTVAIETEPTTVETEPTTVETEPPTEQPVTEEITYNYSGDIDLLAKLIYLESGSCSEYCQWLVGSTAMNLADENGGLSNVAYDYYTFEVAPNIDSCTPSELSISVARRVLSGDRDYTVKAFRDDYYHEWATPYTQVDSMYFSTY